MQTYTNNQTGYVLVLALLITAGMTALVTRVISKVIARYQQSIVFQDSSQARLLALSGIEVAKSILTPEPKKDNKKQKPITRYLENINRWHTFNLTDSNDGIKGTIKVYITNQAGKIPINALYDFKKKQYKNGAKKILQKCDQLIKKNIKNSELEDADLVQDIKRIFEKNKKPLDSITQLMDNKKYAPLCNHLFATPEKQLCLTDIFSTEADCDHIQPLLLSPSVQSILGLKSRITQAPEPTERKELVQKITKNIPKQIQWKEDWKKYGQPLYQKQLKEIPKEVQALFDNKIGADVFSVVCYGSIKTGSVETSVQKVYAILEKGEKRISNKENQITYTIRKLYWL